MALIGSLDDSSRQAIIKTGYRPPRLFIANWAGHDFTRALEYTSLKAEEAFIPITEGDVDFRHPDRLIFRIRSVMRDFREQDYLVRSGHWLITVLAILALRDSQVSQVNVLEFDPVQRRYRPYPIPVANFLLPLAVGLN